MLYMIGVLFLLCFASKLLWNAGMVIYMVYDTTEERQKGYSFNV